ncbi:MAG TPA: nucleoside triphosphate pyrophosphohydrolase [Anaerolineales bacterium]|nr:nucleoside triphosphate pyrophosphohydrolase [Anaerolineales bacterium]
MSNITLLGLGPGDPSLLTRQAWDALQDATEIYLRTRQHPTIAHLPEHLTLHSFDSHYETGENFEQVYEQIIQQILELGQRPQGVLYAVPGDPFVAEATCPEIARRVQNAGGTVRTLAGVSFLELTWHALGLDPFPRLILVDAFELASAHHPPFPPDFPVLIAQIHSRHMASEVKLTLMAHYPDEFPVQLVHAAGMPEERVESLPLYEIDRSPHTGLLTSLYLPPLGEYTSFESFQEVVAHLRAPDGCPWDRKQTHHSLRPYLIEEAYEALDALDSEDPSKLAEELGDLLFQIVIHAQIAAEDGEFTMADIVQGISAKLIRRHPHVFGNVKVDGVEGVLANWEKLKAEERAAKGNGQASVLDGVPITFPALAQSSAYQRRAARVGFDWPDVEGVFEKIAEELEEIRTAPDPNSRVGEIGDLLFVVAHLANWYDVNPEDALRETNARFRRRFTYIENTARARGQEVPDLSVEEMNILWEEAKKGS